MDVSCLWSPFKQFNFCWGNDDQFQISNISSGDYSIVEAGGYFTCAIELSSNLISCWGQPTFNLTLPPSGEFMTLSLGRIHGCGIRINGSIACWGLDTFGCVDEAPITGNFTQLSLGYIHSCALRDDFRILCWGYHDDGIPIISSSRESYSMIASGDEYICALSTIGNPKCWGLGDGTLVSFGTYSRISAGVSLTCTLGEVHPPPDDWLTNMFPYIWISLGSVLFFALLLIYCLCKKKCENRHLSILETGQYDKIISPDTLEQNQNQPRKTTAMPPFINFSVFAPPKETTAPGTVRLSLFPSKKVEKATTERKTYLITRNKPMGEEDEN